MARFARFVPILALTGLAATAFGWDETGHKVVARIAWDTLGKSAKGLAARETFMNILMKGDEAYLPGDANDVEAFLDAANWPDFIKRKEATGPFVDLADKYNDETYPPSTAGREKDSENNRCKTWHYFDTPLNLAPGTSIYE
ncbi:MAG: hypothetical protein ABUL72_04070, partial [Armatimonadota bacterium]